MSRYLLILALLGSAFGQGVLLANQTTPVPYNTGYMARQDGSIVDFIQGYNPGGACNINYNPSTQQYSYTDTSQAGILGCVFSYQGPLALNGGDPIVLTVTGIIPDVGSISGIGGTQTLSVSPPPVNSVGDNTVTIDTIGNSGATRSANVATIKTTSPHGLLAGQGVSVTVTSDSSFNASFTSTAVISTPTTTSFTYANTGPDVGAGTAGGGTAMVSTHGYTYPFSTTVAGSWLEHYSSGPTMTLVGGTNPSTDPLAIYEFFHDHCCFNTQEDAVDGRILLRTAAMSAPSTWTPPVVIPTQACAGGTQCNPNLVMSFTNASLNPFICYVMFEIKPSFGNYQGAYCQSYDRASDRWTGPTRITALPAGNPSAKLYTSNGGVNRGPNGTYIMAMWDGNSQNKTYLVTSTDGVNWGDPASGGSITLLADSSGNPISIPSGQNETTIYWIPGTTKYIGFSRAAASSSAFHDKNLKYIWSSDGIVWNIGNTTWPASNNQISPITFPAPGGKVTLMWAERIDVAPIARLHQLTFDPVATFGDVSQFNDTQTIWTGAFNTWGYPAAAVSGNEISFCWDTLLVQGSTRHIMCSTAEYAVPTGFISGAMFQGVMIP